MLTMGGTIINLAMALIGIFTSGDYGILPPILFQRPFFWRFVIHSASAGIGFVI